MSSPGGGSDERAQLLDLVDRLEQEGMGLDGGGDGSGVHLLFRTVHNLKSLSAYMGLKEAAAAFHRLEDGLDAIRRGREPWTADRSDQVFATIDLARAAVGAGAAPVHAARTPAPAPAPKSPWGMAMDAAEAEAVAGAVLSGLGVYRIEKLCRRGLSRDDFAQLPVMEDVAELGALLAVHPRWEAFDQGPEEQVVKILFSSGRTREEIARIIFDPLIQLQAPEPETAAAQVVDPVRILVIEDDAATGALLAHILDRHGSCTVAGSARKGFAAFIKAWERSEPFHILFLDLGLPDLSGLAILSAIRKFEAERRLRRNQRCMVVICTASDSHDDIMASLAREADGYLTKPVSKDAIEEKVALVRETWIAEG